MTVTNVSGCGARSGRIARRNVMISKWTWCRPRSAAYRGEGRLGGFLEVSVRHGVDGARHEDVAYVEGWYVEPDLRGQNWGRTLMEGASQWALERGYAELGSDAEQDNTGGIAAHRAMGFRETFRLTFFLKDLKPD
jgi:aminoglycoside 6'-N-acetyltransferase I